MQIRSRLNFPRARQPESGAGGARNSKIIKSLGEAASWPTRPGGGREILKATRRGFIECNEQSSGFDISVPASAPRAYCHDTGIVGNLCPIRKFPGVRLEISVTTSFGVMSSSFTVDLEQQLGSPAMAHLEEFQPHCLCF